jgi:hypothetical protein
MILKASFAVALFAAIASPAFAQDAMQPADAMKPAGAMASGDHMMAADHAMKPMSKGDKAMMMKCHKMSAAKMKKNAGCTKLMAMHPAGKM